MALSTLEQSRPLLSEDEQHNAQDTRQDRNYGSIQSQQQQQQHQQDLAHSLAETSRREAPVTPLPKMQIAILCIMRMSEPIALLGVFPFLPEMVHDNLPGVPKTETGYYIGFIESIFAIVQFGTVFFWGRTSDRIGRKPVILIGLAGTFISTNCYGLSKTFPQMIISRCIAGLMNANIGVIKSTIGELTDETNQARAFSFIPLAFAFGSIIGPSIGGKLSNPTQEFPQWFGNSAFLAKYPYWLPCFVCSWFNLIGFFTGLFFLKETLPSQERKKSTRKIRNISNHTNTHGDSSISSSSTTEEAETVAQPTLRDILTRDVITTIINSALMNFVNLCYIAILPLFMATAIDIGGISFSKQAIGYYLAANGCVIIVVQLLIFPRMVKAMGGPLNTLRRALTFLPFTFICFGVAHFIAKYYGTNATVAVLGILLLFRGMSSIMVVSSTLCINNVVPTRTALGTINGLQQSLACLSRAIGPVFATSAFAFSITHTYSFFDGQAIWLVFVAIALLTWYTSSRMRNANEAQWRRHAS